MKNNESIEIVKILLSHDKQEFILKSDVWEDPAAWGILLVDLAKHIAISYSQANNLDSKKVLQRIRNGFDIEWESPSENL